MKSDQKSKLLGFTGIVILVLMSSYLPNLFYVAYRVGLVRDIVVNGQEIEVDDGWFPVYLWKPKQLKHQDSVFLFKIRGWLPGMEESAGLSRYTPSAYGNQKLSKYIEKKPFPWGEATILDSSFNKEVLGEDPVKMRLVLSEKHGIMIQTSNLSFLGEIKSIKAKAN